MTPNAPNTKGKNRLMSITLSLQNKEVINKKKTRDNNEKHFYIACELLFNTKKMPTIQKTANKRNQYTSTTPFRIRLYNKIALLLNGSKSSFKNCALNGI